MPRENLAWQYYLMAPGRSHLHTPRRCSPKTWKIDYISIKFVVNRRFRLTLLLLFILSEKWKMGQTVVQLWGVGNLLCNFFVLTTFDVNFDLLLYRRTDRKKWNLFVNYTINKILRALWLAEAFHPLEDRRTNDVTAWRDSRVVQVSLACKDFQNSWRNQNEKYPALVEVFNGKQVAECLTSYILWTTLSWNEVG